MKLKDLAWFNGLCERARAAPDQPFSHDEVRDAAYFLFLHGPRSDIDVEGLLGQLGTPDNENRRRVEQRVKKLCADREAPPPPEPLPAGDRRLFLGTELINATGILILEELGSGGQGDVSRATSEALGKEIAVKEMPRQFGGAAVGAAMQLREAHILSDLRDKNLVEVYWGGYSGDKAVILMEFVPGLDLGEWIKVHGERLKEQRPQCVVGAARAFATVARALHRAHTAAGEKRIIHRDVKPSNILGCEKGSTELNAGTLKLGDFGAATFQTEQQGTGPVGFVGTWGFAAPEQVDSLGDERADVFGLGMSLLTLVTGGSPFSPEEDRRIEAVESLEDRTRQRQEYAAVIASLRGRVLGAAGMTPIVHDAVLRLVIARCLAAEPEARYQTAEEMAKDLEDYADDRRVRGCGYEYTLTERFRLFWQRIKRPEERFQPDRQTALGLAFLALVPVNVLVELLDWTLRFIGLDTTYSNAVCSAVLAILMILVLCLPLFVMKRREVAGKFFGACLAYIWSASMLIYLVIPSDDMPLLTQVLFVQAGLFSVLLGLLGDSGKNTWGLGLPLLILAPIVHLVGTHYPAVLSKWGPTLMGAVYLVIFVILGLQYVDIRGAWKAVAPSETSSTPGRADHNPTIKRE